VTTRPETAFDVAVIGAGPAGSAAATHLARAGTSVVLIDKSTFPRDKCCGDGLTTLALRELEHAGLRPSMVDDWFEVDAAWLRAPSGREVRVPLPTERGVFAAIAPRLQLDAALVDVARSAGAKVRTGAGFADIDPSADPATRSTVTLDDGSQLAVRHVVAADGMWSPVRRALGRHVQGYLGEWHAVRQYVGGVSGPAAQRLYVWFEPDLLPGYAWSFPLPHRRVNVGYGVLRADGRTGREVKEIWQGLLDRPHIRAALGAGATPEERHQAWPIPARIDAALLDDGPVLFAGDAAAATDVLTGEGIGQALLTGRLAAEAITADEPDRAGARYARAVRRELVADHKMSAFLGGILAHRRGANGAMAIVDHSGGWGRRNFARWMFEDEPRALLLTPRRWHRRILARPGAYLDSDR
jgi:geranylgeranyl reductase family protein